MPETESNDSTVGDLLATFVQAADPMLAADLRAAAAMSPQHPAAPETETDANGLRELLAAATPGPWQHYDDHLVWPSERGPAANDPIAGVSEAHEECAALIVTAVNALPSLLADLDAARERVRVVEGERDEWKRATSSTRRWALGEIDKADARAESAEAAHEAEKAAHERLRAGVEALADEWAEDYPGPDAACNRTPDEWATDLRSLLGGGGAR